MRRFLLALAFSLTLPDRGENRARKIAEDARAAARDFAEMPTQPADRFADSIGVCTHWTYPDSGLCAREGGEDVGLEQLHRRQKDARDKT